MDSDLRDLRLGQRLTRFGRPTAVEYHVSIFASCRLRSRLLLSLNRAAMLALQKPDPVGPNAMRHCQARLRDPSFSIISTIVGLWPLGSLWRHSVITFLERLPSGDHCSHRPDCKASDLVRCRPWSRFLCIGSNQANQDTGLSEGAASKRGWRLMNAVRSHVAL